MIVVLARFRMSPHLRGDLQAPMEQVIGITRQEEGCITYDCAEDVLEPGLFRVSEVWTDREALAAHAAAPHLAEWTALRQPLGMTDRHVEVFEVTVPGGA